ncbi:DNA helicase mcm9 [Asimina triloba]
MLAGLVTTLSTRTTVFGATNPKGQYDPNQCMSFIHILHEDKKDKESLTNGWTLPMLRRYIHYVKEKFKPVLTKEAKWVISSYYQLQRRSATENAAHARLMFRNEVSRLDAIAAILCIESSMTTSAIVDSVGNALHSNFTENPDQEFAKQERIILEKLKSIDEYSESNSLEELNSRWCDIRLRKLHGIYSGDLIL